MFCGIFSQRFDAFRGNSKIVKIKRKAVSATGSSSEFNVIVYIEFLRVVSVHPNPYCEGRVEDLTTSINSIQAKLLQQK